MHHAGEGHAVREVHVWRFSLAGGESRAGRLEAVLSASEKARAARFRFERDRQRFIIARAAYRGVLARYAGLPAAALPLTSVHGEKPRSTATACAHNLSHAEGLGVVAVAADGDIGVDLDFLNRRVNLPALARVALTPREYAVWDGLPAAQQRTAFFSIWTRKEAVLKATGDRRAFEFRDLDLGSDEAAAAGAVGEQLGGRWAIETFTPAEGYCAAIALRSAEHRHLAEALAIRLLGHDDDHRLCVCGNAAGPLDFADGGLDFVH